MINLSPGNLLWPILLSLMVLALIGWINFEPGAFREIRKTFNPWLLASAVGVLVLRIVVGGWRLRYVSHNNLSLRYAFRGQLLWDFSSNITPSTIGGAPFAALFIARDARQPVGEITSVMLFAMLLDQIWFAVVIPIVLIASLVYNVFPETIGTTGSTVMVVYFVGTLIWIGLFGYATLVRPQILERIIAKLFRFKWLRRFRDRAALEMVNLKDRAALIRSQPPRFFLVGFGYTVVIWVCRYLSLLLVVMSVYPALEKAVFFFRTIAMMLGALVLPTPGGSGGLEAMYALFFGPLLPRGYIAPTLLTWRFLAYYSFVIIGAVISAQVLKKALMDRQTRARDESVPDMTL